jgi:hypothetical protein
VLATNAAWTVDGSPSIEVMPHQKAWPQSSSRDAGQLLDATREGRRHLVSTVRGRAAALPRAGEVVPSDRGVGNFLRLRSPAARANKQQ